jgi:16S rRNA (guanine1207-N2)-methyltransferase
MHPALETLMLAFTGEGGMGVPRRALFLGARFHPVLADGPEVIGWQPLRPLADEWDRAGLRREDELPAGTWPVVMVLPGKSRDETLHWFALACGRVETGGSLVVAMPNTAGAARFEKELARATGRVDSIQKHKCRAFHAVNDGTWNRELLDEWLALGNPCEIPGTGYLTTAGVFSSGHIDPGSRLLADHLPANLRGRVADLGAGWGYLTDMALRRCPGITSVDLYEADSRALDCARKNLAGQERTIAYHWHDVAAGVPGAYDAILMNPPFHTGQETDVDLGRAFLTSAAAALARNGRLFVVANRQLPYEAVLDSLRLAWRKPAEDATYKLLFAEKR